MAADSLTHCQCRVIKRLHRTADHPTWPEACCGHAIGLAPQTQQASPWESSNACMRRASVHWEARHAYCTCWLRAPRSILQWDETMESLSRHETQERKDMCKPGLQPSGQLAWPWNWIETGPQQMSLGLHLYELHVMDW